jgi:hypothetical protein
VYVLLVQAALATAVLVKVTYAVLLVQRADASVRKAVKVDTLSVQIIQLRLPVSKAVLRFVVQELVTLTCVILHNTNAV